MEFSLYKKVLNNDNIIVQFDMISSVLKCSISLAEVFLIPGSLIFFFETKEFVEKYGRSKGLEIKDPFSMYKDKKIEIN
jgi:hypothetical protein